MLSKTPPSRFEIGAYLILVAGVAGDHLSTGLALARENIYESNPMALMLMQKGLWVPTDVALILISVGATYVFLRILKKPIAKYMLIYPALAGLIRLVVTMWNFSLLI
jgi:hypothetical protein